MRAPRPRAARLPGRRCRLRAEPAVVALRRRAGLVRGRWPVSQALRDLLRAETDRLKDAGLYKREVVFSRSGGMAAGGMVDGKTGQPVVNYTTHDFLGLSVDPQLQQAAIRAIEEYVVGLASQRVIGRTLAIHKELEDWLHDFLKVPDVILYGSGYHANLGVFAPL